jgi:hypothetical protein
MLLCGLVTAGLCAAPGAVRADDPKYEFGKQEEVKTVVWKVSAGLGALGTYGNSRSVTINGSLNVSRNDGKNKIALDAVGAYSEAWVRSLNAVDADMNQDMNGINASELQAAADRAEQRAAANWLAKLRYDRFFTPRNSGYVSAFVGQDIVAAKTVLTGGQIGFSRLLVHSDMHELAAEIGYDLTYVDYAATDTPSTLIHSARLFLGYVLSFKKDTALNASVEALINGNPIDVGPAGDPDTHKGFGEASRVIGKLSLTTLIWKALSLKVGLTARYDNAPAPLAIVLPKDASGATIPLMQGLFMPRADRFDLLAEMGLVVTFL